MSESIGKWEQVKAALPDVLAAFQVDITEAEARLSMKGKSGTEAIQEQPGWVAYYGMRKAELSKVLKYIDSQVEACRSRLFKKYLENYSRALSERAIHTYVDSEAEYLGYLEVYLEVEEIRDSISEIHSAFVSRGFSLRDWTALKVVSMQNDVI